MKIELDLYHAEEFIALGEALVKIGSAKKLRHAEKGEDVACEDATQAELPLTGEVNSTPAPETQTAVRTRRTRRTGPVMVETPVAPAPAPIDVEPVATNAPKQAEVVVPEEPGSNVTTLAPAAPATSADAPKAEDLANATRALAKKDFEVAKKLLDQFGVKRFGELPVERYAAYAKAIALL